LAFIVDTPQVKRLIQSEETKAIIKFLRENPKTTIDKVVKHLQEEKVCSRLTTLGVIEKLLIVGLIKDDRRGKYFHSLSYNEQFDFRDLLSKLFKSDIQEDLKIFDRFLFIDQATDEQLGELHNYLDEAVYEHYRRLGYYESDPFTYSSTKKQDKGKRKKKA
jgi:predicted transcriptional regulator